MDDEEITGEVLNAYIDGELPVEYESAVADYLRRHSDQLRDLCRQLELDDALRRRMSHGLLQDPIPEKIQHILDEAKRTTRRGNGNAR